MQTHFYDLAASLERELERDEILTLWFAGERSDFIRFNHGKVRQAGQVEQRSARLRLIGRGRQASVSVALSGTSGDAAVARQSLRELRDVLVDLPPDPHLLIATEVNSSEQHRAGELADPHALAQQVVAAAGPLDLVGIYAAGPIYRGFANSLGQRNWHEVENFNFEWSLYHRADKAVKAGYAGSQWRAQEFEQRLAQAGEQLALLERPARTIAPGEYRTYLAPRALDEILGLLCWGGFSAKSRLTKRSPLIRMEQGARLHEMVSLSENTEHGLAPAFQSDGFVKPARVPLIVAGKLGDALIAPRTAQEYGLATNGAGGGEHPDSLDLAGGALAPADALAALDTGLYINNLWYLNFSDRSAARITGMTRFATFWVERGQIVAPVNVMRFDDTIYRMLGEQLIDFTSEREALADPSTYGERSTSSSRLPGALVRALRLTL